MIVFIDRQHAGKPNKLADRGASVDIDGDSTPEREALITGQIALELEKILILNGIHVMPISDGLYSERHDRVNKYAAMHPDQRCVYLAMHLNAGGGDYGAYFYDARSANGKTLARYFQKAFTDSDLTIAEIKTIPCCADDWTNHAYNTIKGVGRPVALCVEPLFMDNDKHAQYLTYTGIQKIANLMALAIINWGING